MAFPISSHPQPARSSSQNTSVQKLHSSSILGNRLLSLIAVLSVFVGFVIICLFLLSSFQQRIGSIGPSTVSSTEEKRPHQGKTQDVWEKEERETETVKGGMEEFGTGVSDKQWKLLDSLYRRSGRGGSGHVLSRETGPEGFEGKMLTKIYESVEALQLLSNNQNKLNAPVPPPVPPPSPPPSFSLSKTQSLGFYEEPEDIWLQRVSLFREQRNKQQVLQTSRTDPGNVWFQDHFEPEWSCSMDERVGQMGDGGKWICDFRPKVKESNCLVYSIGSSDEWSFEEALFAKKKCEIITFDHTTRGRGKPSFVKFLPWGLGSPSNTEEKEVMPVDAQPVDAKVGLKDLNQIIEDLGHADKEIDILKIDIESAEYDALMPLLRQGAEDRKNKKLGNDVSNSFNRSSWRLSPPIRQVLIELHIGLGKMNAEHARELLQGFADVGYVIFHKEPNIKHGGGKCTEYSLLYMDIDGPA